MAAQALRATAQIPVPVQPGASPTTYATLVVAALLLPFVYALFKFWPLMRKIGIAADERFRADLMEEVRILRNDNAAERRECARSLTAMQMKMDAVQRQFFTFQLELVRHLPNEAAPSAQRNVNAIIATIAQPIEDFMPEIEEAVGKL